MESNAQKPLSDFARGRRRRRRTTIDERIVARRRELYNESPAEAWRKHHMNVELKAIGA